MKKILAIIIIILLLAVSGNKGYCQYITTVVGNPWVPGYSGDGGKATNSLLNLPSDIIFDTAGNYYIADYCNNVVRKVDTLGIITTIAGSGYGCGPEGRGKFSGDGGDATAAAMNGPIAIAMDKDGNILIADRFNHVIRRAGADGSMSTIAGTPEHSGYSGNGGMATDAKLNQPAGLAIDRQGNIFIADMENNVVRKINTSGIISTVAGSGWPGLSGIGGPATACRMNRPTGLAIDKAGALYISDTRNNAIRRVGDDGLITTFAGGTSAGYSGDGLPATIANLDSPRRIAFDSLDNLYIADYYNNVVRKVTFDTHVMTTAAGCGYGSGTIGLVGGYWGEDSLATIAMFYLPFAVACDRKNFAYICDRGNHIVRKIGPQRIFYNEVNNDYPNDGSVIELYPNPVFNGYLSVIYRNQESSEVEWSITNLLGQCVYKETGVANSRLVIPFKEAAGIYYVTARTAKEIITRKIVVQDKP